MRHHFAELHAPAHEAVDQDDCRQVFTHTLHPDLVDVILVADWDVLDCVVRFIDTVQAHKFALTLIEGFGRQTLPPVSHYYQNININPLPLTMIKIFT